MTHLSPETPISGGPQVQRAIQAINRHIREERLRVGDVLPSEGWFASESGVSRAVMREAMGAMAALHMIDVGNGRKPKVAAIDGSVMAASLGHAISTSQVSVAEVWEVRRTLEVRTAELAARFRADSEAKRLSDLADRMAAAGRDLQAITTHDVAFHRTIAEASRNALYRQIISSFTPLMQVAVPAAWRTRESHDQRAAMLERHLDLARAIEARDPEKAAVAMNAHFESSIGDILAGASWTP